MKKTILILAVIIILGGVWWWQQQSPVTETQDEVAKATDSWLTYERNEENVRNYQIKYPDTWTLVKSDEVHFEIEDAQGSTLSINVPPLGFGFLAESSDGIIIDGNNASMVYSSYGKNSGHDGISVQFEDEKFNDIQIYYDFDENEVDKYTALLEEMLATFKFVE